MSQCLRNNIDFLRVLKKSNSKQRRAILQAADNQLLKAICECVINVLRGTVKINPKQKTQLKRYKASLRELADKGVPLKKKKKTLVQKGGGFLSIILPTVLQTLASILP